MKHIPSCAQSEHSPCPANMSLHNESVTAHWWSGFPGAYCMKCGAENKDEVCISGGCRCPCHDAFWAAYEQACDACSPIDDQLFDETPPIISQRPTIRQESTYNSVAEMIRHTAEDRILGEQMAQRLEARLVVFDNDRIIEYIAPHNDDTTSEDL